MSDELILYDLPTKGPKRVCWSLNPWKSRFALNYKGIPYKTEWVEYPDVESLWKSFNIQPNDPKDYHIAYTSPMIRLPDGTYVMDSNPISKKLEELYPSPSLHLDSPLLPKVFTHVTNIVSGTRPIWMPLVPEILSERGAEYFHQTRKQWFGVTLQEMHQTEGQDLSRWDKVKGDGKALGDMLRESGGPYFLGAEPSYADFVLAGMVRCLKIVNQDAYERAIRLDEAIEPHYRACGKWMERDDH